MTITPDGHRIVATAEAVPATVVWVDKHHLGAIGQLATELRRRPIALRKTDDCAQKVCQQT